MRIDLCGGFGEKGRTCLAVAGGGSRVLLDVGIKVGAAGPDYYPLLDEAAIAALDALVVSHAHEDHVGGLAWLLSRGFRGRMLMTAATAAEAPATLAAYAEAEHLARFPFPAGRIETFSPGDTRRIGGLTLATGRCGHVAGGVWIAVDDGTRRLSYSGDVLPGSRVFAMDPMPPCDLLIVDASYGADPVPAGERVKAIADWIAAHPQGCLLPTPLSGRSLELLAILPEPFAIYAGMRPALAAQIAAADALRPEAAGLLARRLAAAMDWHDAEPLPTCPLLCDDGMGTAGPSARLIPQADAAGYPILLTGHLPAGSPADLLFRKRRAAWLRMPTHPNLHELVDIWQAAGRPVTLGHSCEPEGLTALRARIPTLRGDLRTGQSIEV